MSQTENAVTSSSGVKSEHTERGIRFLTAEKQMIISGP